MEIVLASASPRREALLKMLRVKQLRVIPSNAEEIVPEGLTPAETAKYLSHLKAMDVVLKCRADCVIIAADTIVDVGGEVLGKPADKEDAARMLRMLSGREHSVYTGVTVVKGETELTESEHTRVFFRELDDREIAAYIATGEPMDKAGAYGAQGIASLFIERLEGDYFNVMGLPLCRLGAMLKQLGVNLI